MTKSLKIILLFLLGLIILCAGLYYAYKNDLIPIRSTNDAASTENVDEETDDETSNWSVSCESTADSTVVSSLPGYRFKVYVAEPTQESEEYVPYSMLEPSDIRTFSISEFDNVPADEPAYSAIVDLSTDDLRSEYGIDVGFQLCNDDNMTRSSLSVSDHSLQNERAGVTNYLHGSRIYIPTQVGNYRFDGYVYLDGEWYLVGQIALVFTE